MGSGCLSKQLTLNPSFGSFVIQKEEEVCPIFVCVLISVGKDRLGEKQHHTLAVIENDLTNENNI